MNRESIFSQIEGFADVLSEIAEGKKNDIEMQQQSHSATKMVNHLHPKKLLLRVVSIMDELCSKPGIVKTLRLVAADGLLPPFEAGQYINLSINIGGVVTSRAYSLSSAPSHRGYYDITVQRVDEGFVSSYLVNEIKLGDSLESTSPSGNFHYNPLFHGNDLVMLAGGSGVTPMMSMIRQYINSRSGKKIHLVYLCRTPEDIIFLNELKNLAAQFEDFTFTKIISRPKDDYQGLTGHITVELLASLIKNMNMKTYYLCGPTGMCNTVKNNLLSLGIRSAKIRRESFGESVDVTRMVGWPDGVAKGSTIKVKIAGGKSFEAPIGEPLLNSLDREGVKVPSSCHAGECSLCRVKLLDGDVFKSAESKERWSDKKYGYIHSCSSYPVGDIEIEI